MTPLTTIADSVYDFRVPNQRPLNSIKAAAVAGTILMVVGGGAAVLAKLRKDQNVADAGYAQANELRQIHLDLLALIAELRDGPAR